MGSRWRLNYTLAQLLLVVVMVANVCGVVVAVRADMRPHVEIVEARFSADGRTLMAVLDDNRRVTCDAATGKVVDSAPIDWPPTIGSVDSEGGTRRYLAADCNTWAAVCRDGHVEFGRIQPARRWTAAVPSAAMRAALAQAAGQIPPRAAISDNAAIFALGYIDSLGQGRLRVAIWDVASGRLLRTVTAQGDVWRICPAPDGRTLAVQGTFAAPDRSTFAGIGFWDVASGRQRGKTLVVGPDEPVGIVWYNDAGMTWTPDSDTFVWAPWPSMFPPAANSPTVIPLVRSVRLSDGRQRQLDADRDAPRPADAQRPWERLLASADGGTVLVSYFGLRCQFFDAATLKPAGKPFPVYDPYRASIRLLSLSPDSKELAATTYGGSTVRIFDREGNFRRDLFLYEKTEQNVDVTVWINALVFLLCLWLIVRQFRRRHVPKGPGG